MQLKWSYYIATNVCSRKSATTFGDLPDCWTKDEHDVWGNMALLGHNELEINQDFLVSALSNMIL